MFKETRAFLLYIFYIYVYIYIYFLYIENIQYNIQYTIDISILSTPFLSSYCFRETQSDVTGEAGHATCSFLTFYLTSDQPLYPMHEQLRHPLWTRWTLLQMHWTLPWTQRCSCEPTTEFRPPSTPWPPKCTCCTSTCTWHCWHDPIEADCAALNYLSIWCTVFCLGRLQSNCDVWWKRFWQHSLVLCGM